MFYALQFPYDHGVDGLTFADRYYALDMISQYDDGSDPEFFSSLKVFEVIPEDGTSRDVTEDFAIYYLTWSQTEDEEDAPAFCTANLTDFEIRDQVRDMPKPGTPAFHHMTGNPVLLEAAE